MAGWSGGWAHAYASPQFTGPALAVIRVALEQRAGVNNHGLQRVVLHPWGQHAQILAGRQINIDCRGINFQTNGKANTVADVNSAG